MEINMASVIQKLSKKGLINPPKWLPNNSLFEGHTGSVAYGASSNDSDIDVVGFCMPPLYSIFPHLNGVIPGFGHQGDIFHQFQKHHIQDAETNREYDITSYSIVKFFQLAMDNNPNIVDVLFLPRRCVLHSTQTYEYVREKRELFLHKGSWFKFRGYCSSQLSKIRNKSNSSNEKRKKDVEKNSFDTKFAYHCVRLLLEIEQIMTEHTLVLDRNSEILKSIRRGEWTLEQLLDWCESKEKSLETVFANSTLRNKANEDELKNILLECIEMHYGSIDKAIKRDKSVDMLVNDLKEVLARYE